MRKLLAVACVALALSACAGDMTGPAPQATVTPPPCVFANGQWICQMEWQKTAVHAVDVKPILQTTTSVVSFNPLVGIICVDSWPSCPRLPIDPRTGDWQLFRVRQITD